MLEEHNLVLPFLDRREEAGRTSASRRGIQETMRILVIAYGDGGAASTLYRYRAGEELWRAKGHQLDIVPVQGLTEEPRVQFVSA